MLSIAIRVCGVPGNEEHAAGGGKPSKLQVDLTRGAQEQM